MTQVGTGWVTPDTTDHKSSADIIAYVLQTRGAVLRELSLTDNIELVGILERAIKLARRTRDPEAHVVKHRSEHAAAGV